MILDGWKNLILRNPYVEEHALKRLEICHECKHNSDYPKLTFTSICKLCSCPLEAKSRNLESQCDIKKWLTIDQKMTT
jgi:hypothetical protein